MLGQWIGIFHDCRSDCWFASTKIMKLKGTLSNILVNYISTQILAIMQLNCWLPKNTHTYTLQAVNWKCESDVEFWCCCHGLILCIVMNKWWLFHPTGFSRVEEFIVWGEAHWPVGRATVEEHWQQRDGIQHTLRWWLSEHLMNSSFFEQRELFRELWHHFLLFVEVISSTVFLCL